MQHTLADQVQIAVTLDNGTLVVMGFMLRNMSPTLPIGAQWEDGTGKSGVWVRPATDANIFAEITKALPAFDQLGMPKPQPVSYKVVAHSDVPTDRTYRNAWTHDGTKFDHDMTKAKAIHLAHIRHVRTELLTELDKDWMRAMGQNKKSDVDAIETQRQALRDATAIDLSSATTIEQLKALWPVDLPPWRG